jgi:hypothetical protein
VSRVDAEVVAKLCALAGAAVDYRRILRRAGEGGAFSHLNDEATAVAAAIAFAGPPPEGFEVFAGKIFRHLGGFRATQSYAFGLRKKVLDTEPQPPDPVLQGDRK